MRLSPTQKSKLYRAAGRMGARYVRWVHRTSTVILDPPDARQRIGAEHPFILSMWHGQFVMMPALHIGGYRVTAIVARHGDAEALAALLPQFNIECVRGAGAAGRQKERGGTYALRTAVKLLKGGATFSMTADIPPGPARVAGIGIVTIARLSGRPIVPLAVASSRFLAFNTWSRMTINLPYSKLAYVIGEPIRVPEDANEETMERLRLEVEAGLNAVTERAYKLAGGNIVRATPSNALAKMGMRAPLGWSLKFYRAGTNLMRPLGPLLLKLRERQGKENAKRLGERYGVASVARPAGPVMWLHAASVGETNAILPLIERLSKGRDLNVVLTTGTTTSAGLAAQRLGSKAVHQYVPLDTAAYVSAFLDHWKPDLAVFTESEIWPNLILETSERKIPLALVNGRMSGRSFNRWKRNAGFSRPLFSRFDVVLAQNDKLARMFNELGAARVLAVGNLKIDAPPPPVDVGELERLRTALNGRPVLVAASTHEGEEEIIAAAHRLLAREIAGVCTIIAPRHPERGPALAEQLKGMGFGVAQRSMGQLPGERTDIYIADTIGELGTLYALTAVAFIGGSLVDRGGQNPIEAIGHGAAVLTGPHWGNFRDFYRALFRHKGAIAVKDAGELAAAAAKLIGSEAELNKARTGAKTALGSLAGALDRTAETLAEYLPQPGAVRCAS